MDLGGSNRVRGGSQWIRVMAWLVLVVISWVSPLWASNGPTVVPMESWRSKRVVRAVLGGVEGRFLFDTGGGISFISPAFAKKLGREPWGRLSGHRMMGDRIDMPCCSDVPVKVGEQDLGAHTVGVFDLSSLLPKDAEPLDGSLALDLFDGRTITIDFPGLRLLLETPASFAARTSKATELSARLSRELQGRGLSVNLGVPSTKGQVWMELDSGNGGTLLISKPYASLFGLDPSKEGPQALTLEIAKGIKASGRAFTPDMILEGNLGMPFLKDAVMSLDLAAGRLWMSFPSETR